MEVLLSRYRNLTVLLLVVAAQLLLLAYQVRTNNSRNERLLRVWAVTAVTPMAGVVEAFRRNTIGFFQDYFILLNVRDENRRLKNDNDKLRMENVYLRNQLSTAENARALVMFQKQLPSKTVAARVIGNSTVASAKAVFIDRGSTSGVEKGMAVVTPEGIVGKVVAVYPLVSQVLLVTDPTFKVGVESQKGHVHGVLDCGSGACQVEQIQNEEKVDAGEWFFTSGEDRIFPKGFPVGTVVSAQPGQGMKNVALHLSGAPTGVEEVLVILEGVHQPIPTAAPVVEQASAKTLPPPPSESTASSQVAKPQTEADKIVEKYDQIGQEEGHAYGVYGSNVPNFNVKPANQAKPEATSTQTAPTSTPPAQATSTLPASKPGTTSKPAAAVDRATGSPGPVLPLGAPRRKPTATTTSTSEQPPQPQQQ